MKLRIPAKTVEACDICKRPEASSMQKCIVCGCGYCYNCRPVIAGCVVTPTICKDCYLTQVLDKVIERYADALIRVLDKRDNAMVKLRRQVKAVKRMVEVDWEDRP